MGTYSYLDCLKKAHAVNWKIKDVVGGREFDPTRRWLPARLSGAGQARSLTPAEQVKLSHVEMAAYAHLFGFVEQFIAPKISRQAQDFALSNHDAFNALTNFAAEEVKHMALFREVRERVDATVGFPVQLLPGAPDVARAVLSKQTGAVLLLTAVIEWFVQDHYLNCFQKDQELDPFTRDIFKAHWQEEAQHAKMDHLETLRVYATMTDDEKDVAIDDLIDLVGAVHGLLGQQAAMDLDNLERYIGRTLPPAEKEEVQGAVMAAKRYTFIESGVTHPNFQELFGMVTTPVQQEKVQKALSTVLAPAA